MLILSEGAKAKMSRGDNRVERQRVRSRSTNGGSNGQASGRTSVPERAIGQFSGPPSPLR